MIKVLKAGEVSKIFFVMLWTIIGVPMSFIANGSTFLLAFVIALAPLALTLWRNKSEGAKVDKHYLELLRLAGMQQGKAGQSIISKTGQPSRLIVRSAKSCCLAEVQPKHIATLIYAHGPPKRGLLCVRPRHRASGVDALHDQPWSIGTFGWRS